MMAHTREINSEAIDYPKKQDNGLDATRIQHTEYTCLSETGYQDVCLIKCDFKTN
jgi:hypothetical protein